MASSDRTSGSCAPRQESHRAASSPSIAPKQSLGHPLDPQTSPQEAAQTRGNRQKKANRLGLAFKVLVVDR